MSERLRDSASNLRLIHEQPVRKLHLSPSPVRKRRSMARRAWIWALERLNVAIK